MAPEAIDRALALDQAGFVLFAVVRTKVGGVDCFAVGCDLVAGYFSEAA